MQATSRFIDLFLGLIMYPFKLTLGKDLVKITTELKELNEKVNAV